MSASFSNVPPAAKKKNKKKKKGAKGKGRLGTRGDRKAPSGRAPMGFYELVQLQQFDGRWAAGSELRNAVGGGLFEKLKVLGDFAARSEDFVATWYVCAPNKNNPCLTS